jgi:hypothetical protein
MLTWNYRCCATECGAKAMDLKKLPPGWGSIYASVTLEDADDDQHIENKTLYFCPDHVTAEAITPPLDRLLKKVRAAADEAVRSTAAERRRSPKWKQPRQLDDDQG